MLRTESFAALGAQDVLEEGRLGTTRHGPFISTFCKPDSFGGAFQNILGGFTPCFCDVVLLGALPTLDHLPQLPIRRPSSAHSTMLSQARQERAPACELSALSLRACKRFRLHQVGHSQ